METKRFPLRVLLTVTTGRLLTKSRGEGDNGISDLYEILGWMTHDTPFTHQLPRFNDECKPWLLRWFPELAEVNAQLGALDELVGSQGAAGVEAWLTVIEDGIDCRPEYDVPRIPQDDHERKLPYDELVAMRGTDKGIVIVDEHGKVR